MAENPVEHAPISPEAERVRKQSAVAISRLMDREPGARFGIFMNTEDEIGEGASRLEFMYPSSNGNGLDRLIVSAESGATGFKQITEVAGATLRKKGRVVFVEGQNHVSVSRKELETLGKNPVADVILRHSRMLLEQGAGVHAGLTDFLKEQVTADRAQSAERHPIRKRVKEIFSHRLAH